MLGYGDQSVAAPGPHPALTPEGVRDGTPAALALIVGRRGPAVLAYCEAVCVRGAAPEATAEAFARFRGAVAAAVDPRGLDPDGLLRSATRHAAASRASIAEPRPASRLGRLLGSAPEPTSACREVPELLVARTEGLLGAADLDRLERHLRRDAGCRDVEASFDRAEAVFDDPPVAALPTDVLLDVLAAMVEVAPILDRSDDGLDVRPAPLEPPDEDVPGEAPPADRAPAAPSASSSTPVGTPRPAASTPVGVADDDDEPTLVRAPQAPTAPAEVEEDPADELRADPPVARGLLRRHGPLFDVVLPVGVIGAAAAGVLAIAGVFGPSGSERPREAAAPVLVAPGADPPTVATTPVAARAQARQAVVDRLERDRRRRERRTLEAAQVAEDAAAAAPTGTSAAP